MKTQIEALNHTIHKHFLWILFLAHGLAYYFPAWGQAIRHIKLVKITWIDGSNLEITVPLLLLSILLLNAGLGINLNELKALLTKPLSLLFGLTGNLLTPILFGVLVFSLSQHWHTASEIQTILMGLAIVASMPIAGSSTAWSQNSNGNLALSLGLVISSTILSPLLTPVVLHGFGWMTTGDYAEDLHELAKSGTSAFLILSVVTPSLLGTFSRFLISDQAIGRVRPYLKLINSICLITLIYSNAALVLPQTFHQPDWDFLGLVLLITLSLCSCAFGMGWLISRILKTSVSERTSLMFGLGMNNNGTGLVLSSMALADHPTVMLPIIFYNLIQQIMAGLVDRLFTPKTPPNEEAGN